MHGSDKPRSSRKNISYAIAASNGMQYLDGITTPIGRLHIVASDKAILHIYFPNEQWKKKYLRSSKHPLIMRAKGELKEYFAGKRKKFTVPVAFRGTSFQKEVWKVLRKIPYGKTISYADEAKRLGKKNAVRAVGSANGRNPLPIIVPCHRVVASGGRLGGYAGGLRIKKKLLALEQQFS